MKHSRLRSGLTLVEILVVLTVVAILAAIAFPLVSSARDKAREASCQSNLKQIYAGYRLYAQDYNKKYPAKVECLGASSFRAADDPRSLVALLRPYTKGAPIWVCPSAQPEHKKIGVSYMWTIAKYGTQGAAQENSAAASASKALAWDNYIYRAPTPVEAKGNPTSHLNKFNPLRYPHRDEQGLNWLYADGHIKYKSKPDENFD